MISNSFSRKLETQRTSPQRTIMGQHCSVQLCHSHYWCTKRWESHYHQHLWSFILWTSLRASWQRVLCIPYWIPIPVIAISSIWVLKVWNGFYCTWRSHLLIHTQSLTDNQFCVLHHFWLQCEGYGFSLTIPVHWLLCCFYGYSY